MEVVEGHGPGRLTFERDSEQFVRVRNRIATSRGCQGRLLVWDVW